MDIRHISVSRKGVWQLCQQQYKYQYHLKIPNPKAVHKVAEEYVRLKGEKTLGQIAKEVLEGRISIERDEHGEVFCPKLPAEYARKFPEHIRSLEKLHQSIGTEGIVEYGFEFDLDPPNNKIAKGFIDRIIQKGDQFFIIDYKTSKKNHFRKTRSTIVKDLQLRTYAAVIQREFKVPAKNIATALYYLEGGDLIAARFSEASLQSAQAELLEAYNDIASTSPDDAWGNVGDWCKRCNYKAMCPFYRM
jgi:ATP-dependent exoDNAse (exonuclease V) beta subunit